MSFPGFSDVLFQCNFNLYDQYKVHQRQDYGVLDVMGDFGGVAELIMIVWIHMLLPISEYMFNLKALEKLFLPKTSDGTLLI